ncbi:hypothetical protein GGF37_002114 [Kickxella alabastrina]|nr:hypothetical protein GGF37_002114 [Kickxella alabastrina]
MSELVAYEDSPLGEYLKEIESAEALVIDQKDTLPAKQNLPTVYDRVHCWANQLSLHISEALRYTSVQHIGLATRVLETSIAISSESGLLADKYTPKSKLVAAQRAADNSYFTPATGLERKGVAFGAARSILSLIILGGSTFKLAKVEPKSLSALCIVVLTGAAVAGIAVTAAWRQARLESALAVTHTCIDGIQTMVRGSRSLDIALQRALRSVREIEFVSRGYRLPHSGGAFSAIAARPGLGAMWAANHTRETINTVLTRSIDGLFVLLGDQLPQHMEMSVSALQCELAESSDSDALSLDMLRHKFDLHFALRKQWLESTLHALELLTEPSISHARLFQSLERVSAQVQCVHLSAINAIGDIRGVQEAQYTSRRWESLAATTPSDDPSVPDNNGPARLLNRMADTLETIQAKLYVCRESTNTINTNISGQTDSIDQGMAPENIARIFASLKSDIETLNIQYQETLTSLTCPDPAFANDSNKGCFSAGFPSNADLGCKVDFNAVPEGTRVFGYTPLGAEDLDAPEMVFEADVELANGNNKPKLSGVDRSERIRAQRQRREIEQEAAVKRGEISSMLLELKSAIGGRTKPKPGADADANANITEL